MWCVPHSLFQVPGEFQGTFHQMAPSSISYVFLLLISIASLGVRVITRSLYLRGPKSLNFPSGNFQRAKTFRTKCVNHFRAKKNAQIRKCKWKISRLTRTFWTIRKLSWLSGSFPAYPKTFQVSGNFPGLQKLSRLFGNFQHHLENIQAIQKLSRLSRKISRPSGKYQVDPETFQAIQ